MRRLFTKYGMMMLLLAVLISVFLCVMAFFSSTSAVLPNLAGIIATPFRAAGTAITESAGELARYFTEFNELKEENKALKEELARMQEAIRQAEHDRKENELLRDLLGLSEQRRDLVYASAHVIAEDYSNWSSVLTVNKGTSHGVAVGDCVITSEGFLVGVVTEAGLTWSTVRTVLDSDSSIGALVFRSGTTAVARGDFEMMSRGRLTLGYMGAEPDVMAGDLIVTSGLGDYYPAQIVIGYVEEVGTGDDGLAQYAVVRPQVELEGLTQVFIITDFTVMD